MLIRIAAIASIAALAGCQQPNATENYVQGSPAIPLCLLFCRVDLRSLDSNLNAPALTTYAPVATGGAETGGDVTGTGTGTLSENPAP